MDGYSIIRSLVTLLSFSRINVPNVARGLDFHVSTESSENGQFM